MKKHFLSALALCVATSCALTGCKDDSEEDLQQKSEVEGLYINEVCSSGTDWVEIYNANDSEISLAGFHLQDSKGAEEEFTLPQNAKIAAKGFLVLEKGKDFQFGIGGSGDEIKLLDGKYNTIDDIIVPELADNATYSRSNDGGDKWEIMANGTKGRSNSGTPDEPTPSKPSNLKGILVINEVYTFSDQSNINDLDYIELYNTSAETIDVAGLKIWEGGGQAEAWTIPSGKTIPAKGFLVIECDKEKLHNDAANYPSWGLSKNDETIVVADAKFNEIDKVETPNMSTNEAYGRKTDGSKEWVIFAELTKGKSNNGAKEKTTSQNKYGIFVNEVFTNNQDSKTTSWDDTKDFIELYNATDNDIDISGFSLNDDALKEEKRYTFPAGSVIKAKSFLTLDVFKKNENGPVFGLGKGGDKVFLFDKDNNTVDEVVTPEFADNEIYSVGREKDGGEKIVVFTEISKNASNNGKNTK